MDPQMVWDMMDEYEADKKQQDRHTLHAEKTEPQKLRRAYGAGPFGLSRRAAAPQN